MKTKEIIFYLLVTAGLVYLFYLIPSQTYMASDSCLVGKLPSSWNFIKKCN